MNVSEREAQDEEREDRCADRDEAMPRPPGEVVQKRTVNGRPETLQPFDHL
jgi:hypothetical protein